ncbi:hypothetical protein JXB02_02145 [Candidatus Woesearchaeota archaeon]|nr:hypothetical protein [Candidatus Woesearchaeota archaeon]
MPAPKVLKDEWRGVVIIAAALLVLSFIPTLWGFITTPQDHTYMWISKEVMDANNHLNLMLQAKDGYLLQRNGFTSEAMSRLFFNPYVLVIGWLSAISSVPIIAFYHLFRIVFGGGFLAMLYLFIAYLVPNKHERLTAFLIASAGAGFGFFFEVVRITTGFMFVSPDLWVTDLIPFTYLRMPHFALAALLMVSVLYLFLRGLRDGWRYAVGAGILCFLLATVHLFEVITIYLLMGVYVLVMFFHEKRFSFQPILKTAFIVIISIPAMLYNYSVFILDPVYAKWTELNVTVSPNIINYIFGLGFIFFFALYYVYIETGRRKLTKDDVFLLAWIIISVLLMYSPLATQRRFVFGVMVPYAILAALGIIRYFIPTMTDKLKPLHVEHFKLFLLAVFVLLIAGTNILSVAGDVATIHPLLYSAENEYVNDVYLTDDEISALDWLAQNTGDDDTVMSGLRIGNYIPRVAGNRVLLGHWAQTIDFVDRRAEVASFYANPTSLNAKGLIGKFGINYIYAGSEEQALAGGNLSFGAGYEMVYTAGNITLYKVGGIA